MDLYVSLSSFMKDQPGANPGCYWPRANLQRQTPLTLTDNLESPINLTPICMSLNFRSRNIWTKVSQRCKLHTDRPTWTEIQTKTIPLLILKTSFSLVTLNRTLLIQSSRRSSSTILWSRSLILASAVLMSFSASSSRLMYSSSWACVKRYRFKFTIWIQSYI